MVKPMEIMIMIVGLTIAGASDYGADRINVAVDASGDSGFRGADNGSSNSALMMLTVIVMVS